MEEPLGYMNHVPDEILAHIFKLLDGQTLLSTLEVCKRWNNIILHWKENKKSLWYHVYHRELPAHSIETVEEYIKHSKFQMTKVDHCFNAYKLATIWKRIDHLTTNYSIKALHFDPYPAIMCLNSLGSYFATGHVYGTLNIWHASVGHVFGWYDSDFPGSVYPIVSIQLACDDSSEQELGRSGGGKRRNIESDLVFYQVYFLSGSHVYRGTFKPWSYKSVVNTLEPCMDFLVKGNLLLTCKRSEVNVYWMNGKEPQDLFLVDCSSSEISSICTWGDKVRALTTKNSILELDLKEGAPKFSDLGKVPIRKKDQRAVRTFLYPGDVIVKITFRGDISIRRKEEHSVVPRSTYGGESPTWILLHGSLFAVGTDYGSVFLFYVKSDLLNLNDWELRNVVEVRLGVPVKRLAILDGVYPVLLVAADGGLYYAVRFHDFAEI